MFTSDYEIGWAFDENAQVTACMLEVDIFEISYTS